MSEQILALYDVGEYDEVYYDTIIINIILGMDILYNNMYKPIINSMGIKIDSEVTIIRMYNSNNIFGKISL